MSTTVQTSSGAPPAKARKSPRRGTRSMLWWRLALVAEVLVFLGLWQLVVAQFEWIRPTMLPPPTEIASALGELVTDDGFFDALLYSLQNLAVGLALAIVVGIVLGLAMGWFRILQFTVAPLMWGLYATPTVALAPLIILGFGLGDTSKIVLVFIMSVFPIMLNTMEGVQTVPDSLVRAARVFGANGTALGRKVVLPATFPFLLVGLQRGVALAFIGEILGEFLGGAGGIGHMLEMATFDFRMADALAIVVVMVLVINAALIVLALLRRRFTPWHDTSVAKI
ncbi:ABC transporter permease [Conexibacter woesei]|uniref:Binding-protein-dependent transport systems inner membrane component n=1 Tax=Conexibacter woesei (strain DSM 14684 / CCUG 47730 / CIP 108061 / JCM 11494 / NBRC 100937 / ID131577) TaxID=469383 RepID=D3F4N2_CONWI|nr:ABC transporter permease [Conexibacter woesei]ADB52489.1 binding-protein-dependent transport systems inner membrane component [Conexibacter woesei DSM 14684]